MRSLPPKKLPKRLDDAHREMHAKAELERNPPPRPFKALALLRQTAPQPKEEGKLRRSLTNNASMRYIFVDKRPLLVYENVDVKMVGVPFSSFLVLNYKTQKRTGALRFKDAVKALGIAREANVSAAC